MVTIAQSAAIWCNTHTHVDCTHSLTLLHQHSYNHIVRSAKLNYYIIWHQICILKVPEGGGANWSTQREKKNRQPVR